MSGRPSSYTPEIADEICRRIARGESLRKMCDAERDDFMPGRQTVLDWLDEREDFRAKYARAREAQADHLADQMVEIADDITGDPHRDRLRVMTRQWMATKLAPKRYGERQQHEVSGPDGGAIAIARIERVIVRPADTNG